MVHSKFFLQGVIAYLGGWSRPWLEFLFVPRLVGSVFHPSWYLEEWFHPRIGATSQLSKSSIFTALKSKSGCKENSDIPAFFVCISLAGRQDDFSPPNLEQLKETTVQDENNKGLQTRHPQKGLRGQWSVLIGLWGCVSWLRFWYILCLEVYTLTQETMEAQPVA